MTILVVLVIKDFDGDIGVFGGQEKDAGDEIGIDLSRVLTRLLPAPTQMGSDGLGWAQMGSDGL